MRIVAGDFKLTKDEITALAKSLKAKYRPANEWRIEARYGLEVVNF